MDKYFEINFENKSVKNLILNRLTLNNFILKENYYYGDTDEIELDIILDGNFIGKYSSGYDEPGLYIPNINPIDDLLEEISSISPIGNFDISTRMYLKAFNLIEFVYQNTELQTKL